MQRIMDLIRNKNESTEKYIVTCISTSFPARDYIISRPKESAS